MSKHTPGPWTCHRMRLPDSEDDRRCGFVVNGPDAEPLPVRICDLRVPVGWRGFSEGEANARLIAAAPKLLAVCQGFMESYVTDPPVAAEVALRRLYRQCSDVVADATGEVHE